MKLFVANKALIEYEGKILILRESNRYADGTETGNYDFPGGRIDPEETLDQALLREVAEETGLMIEKGDLFHVYENFVDIQGVDTHIVRLYFICSTLADDVELSDDHDDFQWIDPQEHTQWPLIANEHDTIEKYLSHRRMCTQQHIFN